MTELEASRLATSLDALRGPPGGYARAHAGLAAFWREQRREIASRPASHEEEAALEQLRNWLAGDVPFALVLGEDEAQRSTMLARFALAARDQLRMEVIFLPVSACFGTAAEHDALQVMCGLFSTSRTAYWARPRSPNELRWTISEASRGDLEAGEPELLVIVDGIERAADWDPDRGVRFLDGVGRGIHLLISAAEKSCDADESEWRRRLHWEDQSCFTLRLSDESDDGQLVVARARADLEQTPNDLVSTQAALDALAVCLAPITPRDLAASGGLAPSPTLPPVSPAGTIGGLTVMESDGTWHFRSDRLRSAWRSAVHTASIEDAMVERARQLLGEGGIAREIPSHLVRYAGTYWARAETPLTSWASIIAPRWLEAWRQLGPGMVGFVADARRARSAAQQALIYESDSEPEWREGVRLVVWSTLVEGALFEKEDRSRDTAIGDLPYREPRLDMSRPLGVERERAEALLTLRDALADSERELVAAWAHEACAIVLDADRVSAKAVPHWDLSLAPTPLDPGLASELRSASLDSLGVRIANSAALVCAALGAQESLARARTVSSLLRVAALSNLVPYLPEALRPIATSEALQAFREHGDRDALGALLACAPWMSPTDAAWLLCNELGTDWHDSGLGARLVGWAGVTDMIPLLQRIASSGALVDTAESIVRLGRWLG